MKPQHSLAITLAGLLLAGLLAACGQPTKQEMVLPAPTATLPAYELPTAAPPATPATPAHSPGQSAALATFTTADFSGPGICAACHVPLQDEAGADVSMPTAWRSTMMANAARDPVWQAKVSSEVARNPGLKEVIEQKCTGCHMPMAKAQALVDGTPVEALAPGFYDAGHPLHAPAIDGVSCTLCHQVRPDNFGAPASFSGGYALDLSTEAPGRPIFGPFEAPEVATMQASTGFTPTHGPHMEAAEHCATCHDLYTPYVDAEGNVLGEFPEQTPYAEWKESRFAQDGTPCQGCHMPLAEGAVSIASVPAGLAPRQPFYQHFFVGGNAFMLQVLRDWAGDLGATADAAHFDATLARVTEQIETRSAILTLESAALQGDTLQASLHVAPLTGHKFPASFPSRRAWLHVTVKDSAGAVVFESGRPAGDGTIAGNAADADPAAFEPHYDLITAPDQVQIYEPIMGDNEGNVTYTLLRAGVYLKDNRLLPAGADKAALPAEVAVYGEASGDGNFAGGGDTVTYQVDVAGATGPFTVEAELLYETLSYGFVRDLLTDETPLTERFAGYYAPADKAPLRVAAVEGSAGD